MPDILEVRNLAKYYPRRAGIGAGSGLVKAVDGVEFAVASGQTLGIVGESGCGKSTTARMLLQLEKATAGTIRFQGKEVQNLKGRELRDYRAQVQAVFQDPYSSLSPRMRVHDIIAEPLQATQRLSRKEVSERVLKMISAVGLSSGTAERYPHEFSGGQQQRIAIARSLVLLPKLLILDEPVSALDMSIQAQILNLLQDLQDQFGLSYVLISHQLNVVARMCDHIAVMYLGRIVEWGPAQDVVRKPLHPYTQALFSSTLSLDPADRIRRIRMDGQPASPANPPPGCHFHTRCPIAIERCRHDPPQLERAPSLSHAVACHLADRGDEIPSNTKKLSRLRTNGLG